MLMFPIYTALLVDSKQMSVEKIKELNGWIDLLFQNRQKPKSLSIFFSLSKLSASPKEIFSLIAFFLVIDLNLIPKF